MEESIIEKLKKSEEDIEAGRVYDARTILIELSDEYGKQRINCLC